MILIMNHIVSSRIYFIVILITIHIVLKKNLIKMALYVYIVNILSLIFSCNHISGNVLF